MVVVTIGMVAVAFLAANPDGPPVTTIRLTFRRTSKANDPFLVSIH